MFNITFFYQVLENNHYFKIFVCEICSRTFIEQDESLECYRKQQGQKRHFLFNKGYLSCTLCFKDQPILNAGDQGRQIQGIFFLNKKVQ